jgi:hypothetical protein
LSRQCTADDGVERHPGPLNIMARDIAWFRACRSNAIAIRGGVYLPLQASTYGL